MHLELLEREEAAEALQFLKRNSGLKKSSN
jgi:hypothetical protein